MGNKPTGIFASDARIQQQSRLIHSSSWSIPVPVRFLRFLYNKYFLTAVAFVVFMAFFDQNDWFSQKERQAQLNEVTENIAFLNRQIDTLDREYDALMHDRQALERYARERYRMKRDSEDLYIVEKK